MSPLDLREALMLGESQSIEFKSHCRNLNAIGRNVCAFLNSGGGYILCDVDDTGYPNGSEFQDTLPTKLEHAILDKLTPKAIVSVELQRLEGNHILVIEVPAGLDIPYAFNDVIYIREEQRTKKADVATIKDLVLRKQIEPIRWERRLSSANVPEQLDLAELQGAMSDISSSGRLDLGKTEPTAALEQLALVKIGRLTNAGDVLFGKQPSIRYPQLRVRAASFPTNDKSSDEYVDMRSFEGPLIPVELQSTYIPNGSRSGIQEAFLME